MHLSRNFTLKELTTSQTAQRLGIDNTPEPIHLIALGALCHTILQPVREHFGRPVVVSSGYRCAELSKAVGSSEKSQHCRGEAADFEVVGVSNLEVAQWIESMLKDAVDQLILEGFDGRPDSGWIHCSHSRCSEQRRQILRTSDFKNYLPGLIA